MRQWARGVIASLMVAGLALAAAVVSPEPAHAVILKPQRARLAILDLRLDDAADILEGEDDDADVAIERARLALYRGDCDTAVARLTRPDLEDDERATPLLAVARGCARATAATLVVRDDKHGVVVRLQDDADRPLVPFIAVNAAKVRDVLERDLGVRLPAPLYVDLLRDQLSLSAHTGLPEKAAQTTGTVAVAKWGRVMMISPRAAPHGYPWLDTLAHEMTHLALSQSTRDRAPLWLQEGVAKREERRWRDASPFDGQPSSDAVALHGLQTGLALPLTKLGPSIAMLPSAEQAAVAFAEVASFVEYWVAEVGDDALPKLLVALRDAAPGSDPAKAIESVSGVSLADWDKRWQAHLRAKNTPLAAHHVPGGMPPNGLEASRKRRLGELLLQRQHPWAAGIELEQAAKLVPHSSAVRCLHADALQGQGLPIEAARLVARPQDVHRDSGRWWSLHAAFLGADALPNARTLAIGIEPLQPQVACAELPPGMFPAGADARALCEAARALPWADKHASY